VAAVVGRVFWHGTLLELGVGQLAEALDELVQRGFVTCNATSRYAREREYHLSSILRWRIAYDTLSARERHRLHRQTAAWMAAQGRIDLEEALRLAYHLELGGQPQEAALLVFRTAQAAHTVGALEEALRLYTRAHVLAADPLVQERAEVALQDIRQRLAAREQGRSTG
jgi:hypothetical protein